MPNHCCRVTKALKLTLMSAVSVLVAGCAPSAGYNGDANPYFDGKHFHNRDNSDKNIFDVLRMVWGGLFEASEWPESVPNPDAASIHERVHEGMRVTYVNHATVLLQVAGLNILTDPVYSERVSPFTFVGPKRVRAAGIALDQLPDIDLVLISHNHYDHLDTDTLSRLQRKQARPPLVVTGLGNRGLLEKIGMTDIIELGWNDTTPVGALNVHFVECKHRSGRGVFDHMRTLWGSFVIETPAGRVYFAGDTGYATHFKEQGEQWGPFELALLPIGAYEPRWFMKDIHLNPEESVLAHRELGSKQSLAIHFGVFQLTYEAIDDPEKDLQRALETYQVAPETFWVLEPGEARDIRPVSASVSGETTVNDQL